MKRSKCSKILSALIIITLLTAITNVVPVSAENVTYYVDSVGGNDSNNGTSQNTAWKSLGKVSNTMFQPGDRILLKAGCVWSGQLWPKGSGANGNPIIVDKYGTGNKPIINGQGAVTETVKLYNQQYWEIRNLEITNDTTDASVQRRGVYVVAQDIGTCNYIHLINLDIHNIKSISNTPTDWNYEGGGIIMLVYANSDPALRVSTKFNDILIQGCSITNTDKTGIFIRNKAWKNRGPIADGVGPWNGFTNVVIRNNVLDNIGGDGIVTCECNAPLVEYNVAKDTHKRATNPCVAMWPINCDDALYQYNEAYLTRTTIDGEGFDCDGCSNRTIMQYNYSHDNEGGFMLICDWPDSSAFNTDAIVRYNISQNDSARVFYFAGKNTNTQIYNNTIYIREGLSTLLWDDNAVAGSTCTFKNNIIYNKGSGYYRLNNTATTFDYNCFYGNHPASEPSDPHKIIADPLMINPGMGGAGRSSLDGYKLQSISPCIDAGTSITGNGGKDFWGNTVPYNSGATDIGAFEYQGTAPQRHTASVGFSTTQGKNQWSYQEWNGSTYTNMTWDSANGRWKGSMDYVLASKNWQHPDVNDSVRKWVAPSAGTVRITGNPRKTNIGGGDGVVVTIKKNSTVIWGPMTISYNDSVGIIHDFTTSVNAGDSIYFVLNKNGNNWYDETGWDPIISYGSTLPVSWVASDGFSSIQGQNQWYYQEWNRSTYSNMTWDAANNWWKGSGSSLFTGSDWQLPEVNDSVRKWVAARAGTITIAGNAKKTNTGGGDGVTVTIKKNGTVIWGPQAIAYNDIVGVNHNFTTSVNAGDAIYFIINQNGYNWYDNTGWNPKISY